MFFGFKRTDGQGFVKLYVLCFHLSFVTAADSVLILDFLLLSIATLGGIYLGYLEIGSP